MRPGDLSRRDCGEGFLEWLAARGLTYKPPEEGGCNGR